MDFTDYSSIFELLCGYNFVNAVNDTDALKFLDFTTPVKEKIIKTKNYLSKQLDSLLQPSSDTNNGSDEQKALIYKVARYKHKADDLEKKMKQHETKVSNLYLIAGVFAFMILLFSGISKGVSNHNHYLLLCIGTIFLYCLFLLCDFVKKQNKRKALLIIFFSITCVLLILQQLHFLFPTLNRNDNLYCIYIGANILLILIISFRKLVIRRKSHKAIFTILFLISFMIPQTDIFTDITFDNSNQPYVNSIITLVITMIILLLIPFAYDLVSHVMFEGQIVEIAKEAEKENFQKLSEGERIGLSDADMFPFKE